MDTGSLNTTNTWLAIIAIATVVQVAATATVAVFGYRLYARSRRAIDDVERRHIEPVTRRVNEVLDGVNTEVARLRRAGDRVQDTVEGLHNGVSTAASIVKSTVLPGWAVTRGVLAAVSAFRGGGRRNSREKRRLARQDSDETRFVNEGGSDARDKQLRD